MNIQSCGTCGVVLDMDRFKKPKYEDDDGGIIVEHALWLDHDFVPAIICPVCKEKTPYKE